MSRIQKNFNFLTYQLPDQRALSAKVKRCAFSDYVPPRAWTKDRTTESWAGPRYETKLHVCAVNPSAEQVHAIRAGTIRLPVTFLSAFLIYSAHISFTRSLWTATAFAALISFCFYFGLGTIDLECKNIFCGLRKQGNIKHEIQFTTDDLDSQHIFVHAVSQHS